MDAKLFLGGGSRMRDVLLGHLVDVINVSTFTSTTVGVVNRCFLKELIFNTKRTVNKQSVSRWYI